ncbi:hypothetical protein DOTSEDRAFT_28426 [Dothistroma septosporum NZE10]|uniref:Uncharacterized protein n=1 Tax=Dothistroma septosporum (strain NZE10 / CBS 128990) TaxID=675120 RepID=M2XIG3_DOTSN|nr:hypothetical protein DOTSEDRAFT_28426 [Dothistroma septosporum NZE10]
MPAIQNGSYRPIDAPTRGFEQTSFAQYLAHISADPADVHQQAVSSAFSAYSKDTEVPPLSKKRKAYRVPSCGVLARFLPRFDRGSSKQQPGDENGTGHGKNSRKARLRKFFRRCRNRMGKKQQKSSAEKKDSVLGPLKISNDSIDLSTVLASQSVQVTVQNRI